MTRHLLSIVLYLCLIGSGFWWGKNFEEQETASIDSIATCPQINQTSPKMPSIEISSSEPSCQCELQTSCDSPSNANDKLPFATLFKNLLNAKDYEKAMALYNTVHQYSDKDASELRGLLMRELENETHSQENFTELSDLYLADFYDDIDVLLLVFEYQKTHQYFYEALNTLQLMKSFAISDYNQSRLASRYQLFMEFAFQSYHQTQQLNDMISLYQYAEDLALFTNEDRFNRIKVNLILQNEHLARADYNYLDQFPEWSVKLQSTFGEERQATPIPAPVNTGYDTQVAMISRANQFIVPVSVEDTEFHLLLDTGASMTVLTRAYFDQIEEALPVRFLRPQTFNTASGSVRANVYMLDSFKLGPYELRDLEIAVLDFPSSDPSKGLLGMNVLKSFRFQIDQRAALLMLAPRP